MFEILLKLIVTGFIICILFGIYGNIIIWKKNSYFSDGLSHACLLGVVIHQIFSINILLAVYSIAICFALIINYLSLKQNRNIITQIVSQSFLAAAIILAGIYKNYFNISDFFLGNILLIDYKDIIALISITIIGVVWFIYFYNQILLVCISHDIATAYKINVTYINLIFTFQLATIVAITIKILGSLLVTSMLIIPPISARIISHNPKKMIINSIIIGMFTYYLGIFISFLLDTAVVPLIVIINFIIFVFLKLIYKYKH